MALYVISGKGGVGKTHLSTALSYQLSQKMRRVLQVEFSYVSLYSEFFSRPVGFEGVALSEHMHVASWTGLDCLSEYVASIARSQSVASAFLKFPVLKNLIESAPGLREIAVLGKLTSDYREAVNLKTGYDDIVFDAPSTGHLMSLLKVPFGLQKTVGAGPMQRQCDSIIRTLGSSSDVEFVVVRDESEFSVQESKELVDFLKGRFPERKRIVSVVNFSNAEHQKQEKDLIHFGHMPNEMGWFMGAKELSSNWEPFLNG